MSNSVSGDDGSFSPIEPLGPTSPTGTAAPIPPTYAPTRIPPAPALPSSPYQGTPSYVAQQHSGPFPVAPSTPEAPPASAKTSGLQTASLILNAVLIGVVLVGAFLVARQQITVKANERSSAQNAALAEDLKDEVARAQRINAALKKSLADAEKASNSAAAAQLKQSSTVITGVAADLSTCSAAIKEVSGRLVDLISADPAGAGTTVKSILDRCNVVADHAATAAKALDG